MSETLGPCMACNGTQRIDETATCDCIGYRLTPLDHRTLFLPGTRIRAAYRVQLADGTDTIVTQDADGRWEDTAAGFTSPAVDAARAHFGEDTD